MSARWTMVCAALFVIAGQPGCGKQQQKNTNEKPKTEAVEKESKNKSAAASEDDDFDDDNGADSEDNSAAIKPASAQASVDEEERETNKLNGDLPGEDELQKVKPVAVVEKLDGKGGCGEVKIDTRVYKIDCMDDSNAKVESASEPILGEDDIAGAAPVKLPDVVDFRAKLQVGPVLDQGPTLACTSFSLAAVINHELAVERGKPGSVSPMHMWARYANPSMNEAITSNEGKGVVGDDKLPFNAVIANKWDKKQPPPPALVAKLEPYSTARIVDVARVKAPDVAGVLAQGHAIWFALAAAHSISKTAGKAGGPQVVPPYDYAKMPKSKQMGHAIALVGYRRAKNGKLYYLMQNSWGKGWGEKGYAYIDEDTFNKNLRYAYVVDVDVPKGAAPPPPQKVGQKCKKGLFPDAVTAKCAPRCPDGGPRSNGVCPEQAQCKPGQVNVGGKCVRAAPKLKVKKQGFGVFCAPSGCIYGFAKGAAGCSQPNGCVLTCGAPKFKLTKGSHGLRCQ